MVNKKTEDLLNEADDILEESEKIEAPDYSEPDEDEYIPEPEPIKKKSNFVKYLIIGLMFANFTIVFYFLRNSVTYEVEKSMLILVVAFSVMFNVIIIGILTVTGIGKKVVMRFIQRMKYSSGNYMNSLYISKNGTIQEIFKKIDFETGIIRIKRRGYSRNPRLLLSYEKIPTYIHREGNPDPLDMWERDLTSDFSNAELDIVMNSKGAFDVREWLEKNKMFLMIVAFAIVGAAAVAAFFGYSSYEMLRDGTYQAIKCVMPAPQIMPILQ